MLAMVTLSLWSPWSSWLISSNPGHPDNLGHTGHPVSLTGPDYFGQKIAFKPHVTISK